MPKLSRPIQILTLITLVAGVATGTWLLITPRVGEIRSKAWDEGLCDSGCQQLFTDTWGSQAEEQWNAERNFYDNQPAEVKQQFDADSDAYQSAVRDAGLYDSSNRDRDSSNNQTEKAVSDTANKSDTSANIEGDCYGSWDCGANACLGAGGGKRGFCTDLSNVGGNKDRSGEEICQTLGPEKCKAIAKDNPEGLLGKEDWDIINSSANPEKTVTEIITKIQTTSGVTPTRQTPSSEFTPTDQALAATAQYQRNSTLGLCAMLDYQSGQLHGYVPCGGDRQVVYGTREHALLARQNLIIGTPLNLNKITLDGKDYYAADLSTDFKFTTDGGLSQLKDNPAEIARIQEASAKWQVQTDANGFMLVDGRYDLDKFQARITAFANEQNAIQNQIAQETNAKLPDHAVACTSAAQVEYCNSQQLNNYIFNNPDLPARLLSPAARDTLTPNITATAEYASRWVAAVKEAQGINLSSQQIREQAATEIAQNHNVNPADLINAVNQMASQLQTAIAAAPSTTDNTIVYQKFTQLAQSININQAQISDPQVYTSIILAAKAGLTTNQKDLFDQYSPGFLQGANILLNPDTTLLSDSPKLFQQTQLLSDLTNQNPFFANLFGSYQQDKSLLPYFPDPAGKLASPALGAYQVLFALANQKAAKAEAVNQANRFLIQFNAIGKNSCVPPDCANMADKYIADNSLSPRVAELFRSAVYLPVAQTYASLQQEKQIASQIVQSAQPQKLDLPTITSGIFYGDLKLGPTAENKIANFALTACRGANSSCLSRLTSQQWQAAYQLAQGDPTLKNLPGFEYLSLATANPPLPPGQIYIPQIHNPLLNGQIDPITLKNQLDVVAADPVNRAAINFNNMFNGTTAKGTLLQKEALETGNSLQYLRGTMIAAAPPAAAAVALTGVALAPVLLPAIAANSSLGLAAAALEVTSRTFGIYAVTQGIGNTYDVCEQGIFAGTSEQRWACGHSGLNTLYMAFNTATGLAADAAKAAAVAKVGQITNVASAQEAFAAGIQANPLPPVWQKISLVNSAMGLFNFGTQAWEECVAKPDGDLINCGVYLGMAIGSAGQLTSSGLTKYALSLKSEGALVASQRASAVSGQIAEYSDKLDGIGSCRQDRYTGFNLGNCISGLIDGFADGDFTTQKPTLTAPPTYQSHLAAFNNFANTYQDGQQEQLKLLTINAIHEQRQINDLLGIKLPTTGRTAVQDFLADMQSQYQSSVSESARYSLLAAGYFYHQEQQLISDKQFAAVARSFSFSGDQAQFSDWLQTDYLPAAGRAIAAQASPEQTAGMSQNLDAAIAALQQKREALVEAQKVDQANAAIYDPEIQNVDNQISSYDALANSFSEPTTTLLEETPSLAEQLFAPVLEAVSNAPCALWGYDWFIPSAHAAGPRAPCGNFKITSSQQHIPDLGTITKDSKGNLYFDGTLITKKGILVTAETGETVRIFAQGSGKSGKIAVDNLPDSSLLQSLAPSTAFDEQTRTALVEKATKLRDSLDQIGEDGSGQIGPFITRLRNPDLDPLVIGAELGEHIRNFAPKSSQAILELVTEKRGAPQVPTGRVTRPQLPWQIPNSGPITDVKPIVEYLKGLPHVDLEQFAGLSNTRRVGQRQVPLNQILHAPGVTDWSRVERAGSGTSGFSITSRYPDQKLLQMIQQIRDGQFDLTNPKGENPIKLIHLGNSMYVATEGTTRLIAALAAGNITTVPAEVSEINTPYKNHPWDLTADPTSARSQYELARNAVENLPTRNPRSSQSLGFIFNPFDPNQPLAKAADWIGQNITVPILERLGLQYTDATGVHWKLPWQDLSTTSSQLPIPKAEQTSTLSSSPGLNLSERMVYIGAGDDLSPLEFAPQARQMVFIDSDINSQSSLFDRLQTLSSSGKISNLNYSTSLGRADIHFNHQERDIHIISVVADANDINRLVTLSPEIKEGFGILYEHGGPAVLPTKGRGEFSLDPPAQSFLANRLTDRHQIIYFPTAVMYQELENPISRLISRLTGTTTKTNYTISDFKDNLLTKQISIDGGGSFRHSYEIDLDISVPLGIGVRTGLNKFANYSVPVLVISAQNLGPQQTVIWNQPAEDVKPKGLVPTEQAHQIIDVWLVKRQATTVAVPNQLQLSPEAQDYLIDPKNTNYLLGQFRAMLQTKGVSNVDSIVQALRNDLATQGNTPEVWQKHVSPHTPLANFIALTQGGVPVPPAPKTNALDQLSSWVDLADAKISAYRQFGREVGNQIIDQAKAAYPEDRFLSNYLQRLGLLSRQSNRLPQTQQAWIIKALTHAHQTSHHPHLEEMASIMEEALDISMAVKHPNLKPTEVVSDDWLYDTLNPKGRIAIIPTITYRQAYGHSRGGRYIVGADTIFLSSETFNPNLPRGNRIAIAIHEAGHADRNQSGTEPQTRTNLPEPIADKVNEAFAVFREDQAMATTQYGIRTTKPPGDQILGNTLVSEVFPYARVLSTKADAAIHTAVYGSRMDPLILILGQGDPVAGWNKLGEFFADKPPPTTWNVGRYQNPEILTPESDSTTYLTDPRYKEYLLEQFRAMLQTKDVSDIDSIIQTLKNDLAAQGNTPQVWAKHVSPYTTLANFIALTQGGVPVPPAPQPGQTGPTFSLQTNTGKDIVVTTKPKYTGGTATIHEVPSDPGILIKLPTDDYRDLIQEEYLLLLDIQKRWPSNRDPLTPQVLFSTGYAGFGMEKIRGIPLSKWPFVIPDAIANQFLANVRLLDQLGVSHRDIFANNIIVEVNNDGVIIRLRLLDPVVTDDDSMVSRRVRSSNPLLSTYSRAGYQTEKEEDGFYRLFIPDDLPAAKLAIAHHNRFLTQIKNSGKTVSLEEIKRIASDEEITGLLDPASDVPIDELPTDLPTVPPKKSSLLQKLRDVYEQNIAGPCGLPKIGLSPTKKSALPFDKLRVNADSGSLIGLLMGGPVKLESKISQNSEPVNRGVDLPGVEPGRRGLTDPPSKPARPTPDISIASVQPQVLGASTPPCPLDPRNWKWPGQPEQIDTSHQLRNAARERLQEAFNRELDLRNETLITAGIALRSPLMINKSDLVGTAGKINLDPTDQVEIRFEQQLTGPPKIYIRNKTISGLPVRSTPPGFFVEIQPNEVIEFASTLNPLKVNEKHIDSSVADYNSDPTNKKIYAFKSTDGKVVGIAFISDIAANSAFLSLLITNPDYQNSGVGTAILSNLKKNYQSISISAAVPYNIVADTAAERERLRNFYKHNGLVGSTAWSVNTLSLDDLTSARNWQEITPNIYNIGIDYHLLSPSQVIFNALSALKESLPTAVQTATDDWSQERQNVSNLQAELEQTTQP